MDALNLPEGLGMEPPRREGERYVLSTTDEQGGASALAAMAVILLLAGVVAFLRPDPEGEGWGWLELAAGAAFLVVPLAIAGAVLALRRPCEAVLDLAERRVYRVDRRSGAPIDWRASMDLYLHARHDAATRDGAHGRMAVLACGPEPGEDATFRVTLWTDSDESPERLEQCLDALTTVLPWKGVTGDVPSRRSA
jgi:hypothetical protein